jgi:hypothetical protein
MARCGPQPWAADRTRGRRRPALPSFDLATILS